MKTLTLTLTLLVSCSGKLNKSQLQHDWNDVSFGSPEPTECNNLAKDPDPHMIWVHKYLNRFLHQMKFFNPGKFKDLCIMAERNRGISNAAASSDGVIRVYTGLIENASSDADVGAAIAHEVAHYTKGHTTIHESLRIHPKLRGNAKYKEVYRNVFNFYKEGEDWKAEFAKLLALEKAAGLDIGESFNWIEQQADEVGLRFMLMEDLTLSSILKALLV